MEEKISVKIILASTREGRKGEWVARYIQSRADKRSDWHVELLDLKEWDLPFYTSAKLPAMQKYDSERVKKWSREIDSTDAFIIVTPEYNHGYPAPLKNALDTLYNEWVRKAVAFVGYGGQAGGSRAIEQLKQVVLELQMAPAYEDIIIPRIRKAFDEQGNSTNPHLAEEVETMFEDLNWWARALKAAREQ